MIKQIFILAIICETALCKTMAVESSLGFRDAYRCGPNAFFVFSILSGHPEVTDQQLVEIPISSNGSSMEDLCAAAKKLGINAEVRRYLPEEVSSLHLPAIVQFKVLLDNTIAAYHYIVIYALDSTRYHYIDGTTGEVASGAIERLPRYWTGYSITESPRYGALFLGKWHRLLIIVLLVLIEWVIIARLARPKLCRNIELANCKELKA